MMPEKSSQQPMKSVSSVGDTNPGVYPKPPPPPATPSQPPFSSIKPIAQLPSHPSSDFKRSIEEHAAGDNQPERKRPRSSEQDGDFLQKNGKSPSATAAPPTQRQVPARPPPPPRRVPPPPPPPTTTTTIPPSSLNSRPQPPRRPPPPPPLPPSSKAPQQPMNRHVRSAHEVNQFRSPTCPSPLPPTLPPPPMYGRSVQSFRDRVLIGKGTYGEVSRAVDRESGETVAIKKMSITLPGEVISKEGMAITAIRELKALQKLKHPNIVSIKEIATEGGREQIPTEIYLVLEFCEMDLSGIVRTCSLMSMHIRSYMYQILAGLAYIQSQGLLHRDLKTANILVTKGHVVKIADWGLCRWEPKEKAKLTNPVVTLWYRAPELLLGSARYGKAVDMWSCGAILVELLTGKPFMEGRDELDQLHKIFDICGTPEYDGHYTGPRFVKRKPRIAEELRRRGARDDKAIRLAEKLLAVDPANRPSADGAADDDFFWSADEAGNFYSPTEDPASLPRLIPFKPGVSLDELHEYEVKRR